MRVLLLFVDGVGLGEDDAARNPFCDAGLPVLHGLLGVSRITKDTAPRHGARASVVPVDACLGHEGIPQSGTGQTSLLTGVNAVTLHGRHFGPWVPSRLQKLVREESVLAAARDAGHDVTFATAYPEEVLAWLGTPPSPPDDSAQEGTRARRRMPAFLRAGPPLAAAGAGVLTRHTAELAGGNAVASELTNGGWRNRLRRDVPDISAFDAGTNLARIAGAHDLTLFAHYATDTAGHTKDMATAVAALELLDAFVGGLVQTMPEDLLVIMVSDHGNIEDVTVGHTRNPAVGIVIGNGHAPISRRLSALTDVTPAILDLLAL